MTLSQKRQLFTRLMAEFLLWCFQSGYHVAVDQFKRTGSEAEWNAQQGIGIRRSLHLLGLAGDVLLYIGGDYQTDSNAYLPLGEKWESMHPLCRWGGRFNKPDGNHFSLEHQGVR